MVMQGFQQNVGHEDYSRPWPDPTPEMVASPEFEAVWQCIKKWDISVPDAYFGRCHANGNHVRAILDALAAERAKPKPLGTWSRISRWWGFD